MDLAGIGSLLRRLANGGLPATDEERDALSSLSIKFNTECPKFACPKCWFKRLLEEIRADFMREPKCMTPKSPS